MPHDCALAMAIGIILALGGRRLISAFLFGAEENDLTVCAAAALLLGSAALLACYVPARRASRIDPMEALRYE